MMDFLCTKPTQSFTLDLAVLSLWLQRQFVQAVIQGAGKVLNDRCLFFAPNPKTAKFLQIIFTQFYPEFLQDFPLRRCLWIPAVLLIQFPSKQSPVARV